MSLTVMAMLGNDNSDHDGVDTRSATPVTAMYTKLHPSHTRTYTHLHPSHSLATQTCAYINADMYVIGSQAEDLTYGSVYGVALSRCLD